MLKSLTKKLFSLDSGDKVTEGEGNKRKDDYIIILCQRNDVKQLEIQAADPELAELLGYSESEMKDLSPSRIFPPHTNELINDYLEYNGDGNDLAAVLGKVREFSLVSKLGRNVPMALRILPTTAMDQNPRFCLILRPVSLQKALDAGRDEMAMALKKNLVVNDQMVLLPKEALLKDLQLIISYLNSHNGTASLAVINLDNLSDIELKNGAETAKKILNEIGTLCRASFREEDIIASLGQGKIGAVLLEAEGENAKIPLGRLRWKIDLHRTEIGIDKFKVSPIIALAKISRNSEAKNLVDKCERASSGEEIPGIEIISAT